MIRSFADKNTESLFFTGLDRKFGTTARIALRKLNVLDGATQLNDLNYPAGNRLELLKGNRSGQHSIRINSQYRICFRWLNGESWDVEIVDYH